MSVKKKLQNHAPIVELLTQLILIFAITKDKTENTEIRIVEFVILKDGLIIVRKMEVVKSTMMNMSTVLLLAKKN